ncbi:bactericidal permeability-increasing protein-like isoform X2 [Hyperolius riggenbachi]|uniref:bactericidal permeability-increasing protein-like isoform X2 n=1 Tax=Hyperolius riggenbachi TaxID=752182 RepID=UPI0035A27769
MLTSKIGTEALEQELMSINFPEYSGSYDLFLGSVDYDFSGMEITGIDLNSSQISFVPNAGLKFSIDQASITVQGNWEAEYLFISDSGDFVLTVSGISISVGLSLGSDEDGRPTVFPSDCSAYIENMDVYFSDTIDWLINLFDDEISESLRETMESQICPQICNAVENQVESALQNLAVTAKLNDVVAIDFSLIAPPAVSPDSVDMDMKGEIFGIHHNSTPPFSPQPMSLPDDQNWMIYIAVSEFLFNSAGFAYQSSGMLVFNVTDDMIPKGSPVRLNTSSFGIMIPQLNKMYPNMLMKLMLTSPSAPSLNIAPGNVSLAPVLEVQAYAILPNSSLAPLFLLKLTTDIFAEVYVNSSQIVGNLKLDRVQIELEHSDIGSFSVTMMESAMNVFISSSVLPKVNEFLRKGYPLPTLHNVTLENVVLKLYQHYLVLGVDVHYG